MQRKNSIIALAGLPNAGKSTLLNVLVGQKIAIVTPKVQTTRYNTKGIVNFGEIQLVFIDTPGLFNPKQKLEKWITRSALHGINEADIICFITEPKMSSIEKLERVKHYIQQANKLCIAVINKIDTVRDKKDILPIMGSLEKLELFHSIFLISALKNKGIEKVVNFFKDNAEVSPWLFSEDEVTDRTEREIAEEITRETLYFSLADELPYCIEIKTEKWEDLGEDEVRIHQVVHVLKESQKAILVGKSGLKIKEIGMKSRKKIAEVFGKKVHLFLYVKVKEDWIDRLET